MRLLLVRLYTARTHYKSSGLVNSSEYMQLHICRRRPLGCSPARKHKSRARCSLAAPGMLTPLAAAAGQSLMLTPLAAASPSLMWPYTMGGPGCALCCGRPPLVVLTMVGAGLGLPLSEELLVLGIGAALPGLSGSRRLCTLVWLLVGVVGSDLATVSLGSLLRRNSVSLRAQAPRFGGRLLGSVGRQLSVEGRRDGRRLERQLSYRLQSTARSASELLALLARAADQPGAGEPPPPLPPLPGPLQLTLLRRATCNTRTALATAGQVSRPESKLVRALERAVTKATPSP